MRTVLLCGIIIATIKNMHVIFKKMLNYRNGGLKIFIFRSIAKGIFERRSMHESAATQIFLFYCRPQ